MFSNHKRETLEIIIRYPENPKYLTVLSNPQVKEEITREVSVAQRKSAALQMLLLEKGAWSCYTFATPLDSDHNTGDEGLIIWANAETTTPFV